MYTISGVTDDGGIERVFCTAKQAIAPGGVTYTWTITKPDGAQVTGVGAVATVVAGLPGTYSATFTASPTRMKCPPVPRNVGRATGTAVRADLDVDSDNNNGSGPPDRSATEDVAELTSPGKILCLNDDDDDSDGVPDKDQPPPPASDDDLVQMGKKTGSRQEACERGTLP